MAEFDAPSETDIDALKTKIDGSNALLKEHIRPYIQYYDLLDRHEFTKPLKQVVLDGEKVKGTGEYRDGTIQIINIERDKASFMRLYFESIKCQVYNNCMNQLFVDITAEDLYKSIDFYEKIKNKIGLKGMGFLDVDNLAELLKEWIESKVIYINGNHLIPEHNPANVLREDYFEYLTQDPDGILFQMYQILFIGTLGDFYIEKGIDIEKWKRIKSEHETILKSDPSRKNQANFAKQSQDDSNAQEKKFQEKKLQEEQIKLYMEKLAEEAAREQETLLKGLAEEVTSSYGLSVKPSLTVQNVLNSSMGLPAPPGPVGSRPPGPSGQESVSMIETLKRMSYGHKKPPQVNIHRIVEDLLKEFSKVPFDGVLIGKEAVFNEVYRSLHEKYIKRFGIEYTPEGGGKIFLEKYTEGLIVLLDKLLRIVQKSSQDRRVREKDLLPKINAIVYSIFLSLSTKLKLQTDTNQFDYPRLVLDIPTLEMFKDRVTKEMDISSVLFDILVYMKGVPIKNAKVPVPITKNELIPLPPSGTVASVPTRYQIKPEATAEAKASLPAEAKASRAGKYETTSLQPSAQAKASQASAQATSIQPPQAKSRSGKSKATSIQPPQAKASPSVTEQSLSEKAQAKAQATVSPSAEAFKEDNPRYPSLNRKPFIESKQSTPMPFQPSSQRPSRQSRQRAR